MNTHKCEWCGFMEDVLNPLPGKQGKVIHLKTRINPTWERHLCWSCIIGCLTSTPENKEQRKVKIVLADKLLEKIL